jgi:hypothetical protein
MSVSGTLVLPDVTLDLATGGCFSEIGDVDVFETQPNTFVLGNQGILLDCFWETADGVAGLFAVDDNFGPFADAFLIAPDHEIFTVAQPSVSLSPTSVTIEFPMHDFLNDVPASATASATLTPLGDPVTSDFLAQNSRQRVTEQLLAPNGTLTFSTGDTFVMDAESCFVTMFDSHFVNTAPQGPKEGGAAPANDTPDGAVSIRVGGTLNDQTRGTAVEPELQVEACPEEDDRFGHTLWYTFTGTGGPVPIDTAGSNFDTIVAVYDDGLNLLACNDDISFEPIGGDFQAAVTIDTVAGATYYVQAGGFDSVAFTGVSDPEFGRLRVSIS